MIQATEAYGVLGLISEIKDSNDAILNLTRGTRKPTDDEIGTINNHACDVAHFAARVERLQNATPIESEQEIRDSERWRIWRLVLTKMESETNINKFLALDEICQAIRLARWEGGAK